MDHVEKAARQNSRESRTTIKALERKVITIAFKFGCFVLRKLSFHGDLRLETRATGTRKGLRGIPGHE